MTRQELWLTGKPVKFADQITCGEKGCTTVAGVREFDCGFWCQTCFQKAPECSEDGCRNPVHVGVYHGVGTRCRSCEFDYDGELEIYCESQISRAENCESVFTEGMTEMAAKVNDFLKKNGLARKSGHGWFPGDR